MHLYSNLTVHIFLSMCFSLFFSLSVCPPCLYLSPSLSLIFTQLYSVFFLGALTCRGPLAGMVDLSDVRSMSRPCSPLSVFPSPCIIRPEASEQTEHTRTHTCTLECCPHGSENANARMAVVVLKGNDPGRQAPSTRQGQGGQQRDKQTAYSPHPGLPLSLSLTLHSFSRSLCLFLSLFSLCTKSRCKNDGIPN